MARTVGDVAMLLDVMAGRDSRDPLSVTRPEQSFEAMAESRTAPKRVAFSPDLGVTPVDPEIASICRRAAQRFEDMGRLSKKTTPTFPACSTYSKLFEHSGWLSAMAISWINCVQCSNLKSYGT